MTIELPTITTLLRPKALCVLLLCTAQTGLAFKSPQGLGLRSITSIGFSSSSSSDILAAAHSPLHSSPYSFSFYSSHRSRSPLYSSTLQDIDTAKREDREREEKELGEQREQKEQREVKHTPPGQPINLFHSVLCGSYCTVCATECSLTDDEGLAVKEKAPIIVLHGLLGSARNFQSWMKLVQQREGELDREENAKLSTVPGSRPPAPSLTRDIICMDLRNHGRTGTHYGSLDMDFELMAKDVMHTLKNLGLTSVHIVGHSLGGKVAAVAALRLAEEMSHREEHTANINTSNKNKDSKDSNNRDTEGLTEGQTEEQTEINKDTNSNSKNNKKYTNSKKSGSGEIKILSLTMIDVSPVDYADDEAFADVFRTLDIVDDLNGQLPLIGSDRSDGNGSDNSNQQSSSSSSSDTDKRGDGRGDGRRGGGGGGGVNVRAILNDMLGERVSDPMLKAFLLASIQPKERERERDTRMGGLSTTIRALMHKIETSRSILLEQQRRAASTSDSDSEVRGNRGDGRDMGTRTTDSRTRTLTEDTPPEGFEWKFSVEGIVGFRGELGGWPKDFTMVNADREAVRDAHRDAPSDGNSDRQRDGNREDRDVEESNTGGGGGKGRSEDSGESGGPSKSYVMPVFHNPVLVMKGATSRFVRSSHIPSISSLFPNFTLMTVREAGHWLHFEKPKESSDFLIKFIRTVEDRMT